MNERLIDDEPKQPPQLSILDLGPGAEGLVCDIDDPDCTLVESPQAAPRDEVSRDEAPRTGAAPGRGPRVSR